jgi:hypothetical protein
LISSLNKEDKTSYKGKRYVADADILFEKEKKK